MTPSVKKTNKSTKKNTISLKVPPPRMRKLQTTIKVKSKRRSKTRDSTTIGGPFRKHTIKYYLPVEAHAVPLEQVSDSVPAKISSHELLRDFSYFYVEIPFTAIPIDKYVLKSVTMDVTFLTPEGLQVTGHIPSWFPTDESKIVGKSVKRLEVKGDFSLKIPDLSTIGAMLGYAINSPLNVIKGFKEWSSSTIKTFDYEFSVPKCSAGSNGNSAILWTFRQNEIVGVHGGYKLIVIIGLQKGIQNQKVQLNLELTLEDKALPASRIRVKFISV